MIGDDDVFAEALEDSTNLEVKDSSVNTISKLALKQLSIQGRIEQTEELLKNLNAQLKQVSETDLPNAMLENGMREFKLTDGSAIKVKKFYLANIKVENKPEAFKWLIDNGHASLINTKVVAKFGKGQEERDEAEEFIKGLLEDGYDAAIDESINFQTLKAFAKEQTEAGEQLPETITVFVGEKAEIILQKIKK